MQFLNPIALFGFAAAAIPLLIHLLHRGRTTLVPFSNLAFLRVVHQQRMRHLQIRQWLALLLRTLAILCIVAAFARPALPVGGIIENTLFGGAPTHALILVDNSYSTSYRTASGRLFDRIRADVAALFETLSADDEVTVVTFAASVNELGGGRDQIERLRLLERLGTSQEGTRVDRALNYAVRYFAEERTPHGSTSWNRELFLLGDGAQHNWSELNAAHPKPWHLPGVRLYVTGLAGYQITNASIGSVGTDRWMATAGRPIDVNAVVVNSSDRELESITIDLYLRGERVQRRVTTVPPRSSREVPFIFTPRESGLLGGHVELTEDALPLDNRRYFTLDVASTIRVLLVGADADIYYPRHALEAAADFDSALQLLPPRAFEYLASSMPPADVIVLCHPQRLSQDVIDALQRFVAAGGGLLLFPSPVADLSNYNRRLLPALLPVSLNGPRSARTRSFEYSGRPHPVVSGIWKKARAGDPAFASVFDIVAGEGLEPIVHFDDGELAFVAGRRGAGATILAAMPLDLNSGNLPMSGIFAPLMHRLCRLLSRPGQHLEADYLVGQVVQRRLPEIGRSASVEVEGPSAKRLLVEGKYAEGHLRIAIPVDEAGIWTLRAEGATVDQFAVNVDIRESQLSPVADDVVEGLFSQETSVQLVGANANLNDLVLANRFGRELWRHCLILALALLALELWVARAPREWRRAPSGEVPPDDSDAADLQDSLASSRSISKV